MIRPYPVYNCLVHASTDPMTRWVRMLPAWHDMQRISLLGIGAWERAMGYPNGRTASPFPRWQP